LNYVRSCGLRRNAINGHHHFAKTTQNKTKKFFASFE
jgi:hypothetical protein